MIAYLNDDGELSLMVQAEELTGWNGTPKNFRRDFSKEIDDLASQAEIKKEDGIENFVVETEISRLYTLSHRPEFLIAADNDFDYEENDE